MIVRRFQRNHPLHIPAQQGSRVSLNPYNPQHDPLVTPDPGNNQHYSPSYWVASAGTPPEDDGPVKADMDVDVVIVGSGATGMATAYYLSLIHI